MNVVNCQGHLLDFATPKVMGILNVTPDSFYDGGSFMDVEIAVNQVNLMLSEGMDILDIGAASSRPGSQPVSPEEEWQRLQPVLKTVVSEFPSLIISVDTYWSYVAERAINLGASMINDISAFSKDEKLIDVIAREQIPYILMHMQGNPQTMQANPGYEKLMHEIITFMISKIRILERKGIYDILLDPGFGFGKTIDHNYELVKKFSSFSFLNRPMVAGVSRKSMIYKYLDIPVSETLAATTALNLQLLLKGAKLLRVHDVREACQAITLYEKLK